MKELSDNRGLTVHLNLWPTDDGSFDAHKAQLWICGQVINKATDEKQMFDDAGKLISILGKWNKQQFQKLKKAQKAET